MYDTIHYGTDDIRREYVYDLILAISNRILEGDTSLLPLLLRPLVPLPVRVPTGALDMGDLHLGRQFDDPVFPLDVIPHSHLFLLLRVVRVLEDLFDGPETFEVVVVGRVGQDGDDGL